MSTCRCGRRTTGQLCADCRRDERWSESDDVGIEPDGCESESESESEQTDLLVYECQKCDETYEAEGLGPCPECNAYRARCLGKTVEVPL